MAITWPPSPNVGDTVTGPQGAVWQWDGAKWIFLAGTPVKPQLKMSVQVFTSNGTYTPPAGLQQAVVECIGGGGAGGGVGAPANWTLSGGGGGSGGYSRSVLAAAQIGANQTVTIGAGGVGVSGGAGGNGGTTSFGSLVTALGGLGGGGADNVLNGAGGGGAAIGTGQFTLLGSSGGFGMVAYIEGKNEYVCVGGVGGAMWGGNFVQASAGSGNAFNGNPGLSAGAGGSGGVSNVVGVNYFTIGGNGFQGQCVITEYSF